MQKYYFLWGYNFFNQQIERMMGCFKMILVFSLFALLILGCNNRTTKIRQFEKQVYNIEIIQIIELHDFAPITAFDSSEIINQTINTELKLRINNLNKQLDLLQAQIDKAKSDIKNSENPQMVRALKIGLNSLYIKQSRLQIIDSLYRYAPEKTGFKNQLVAAQILASRKDSIVGFSLQVRFKGKEGKLPVDTFNRTYVFDLNQKNVMGIVY